MTMTMFSCIFLVGKESERNLDVKYHEVKTLSCEFNSLEKDDNDLWKEFSIFSLLIVTIQPPNPPLHPQLC